MIPEIDKKFQAKIIISRVRCNNREDVIKIVVHDKNHIEFFDGEMSIEEFGNLISGRTSIINLELRGLDIINKTHESKSIPIVMPEKYGKTYKKEERLLMAAKAVEPYETDGWKADLSQICNSHYYNMDNITPTINFYRFIDNKDDNN